MSLSRQALIDLIADVRQGRSEDDRTDWKRAWWNLGVTASLDEFIKDIAGMANALSAGVEVRRIVVGLDEDGSLFDAPLPGDEADLQQHIRNRLDPLPTVAFEAFLVEGRTLTVISISPPFDPPYVARGRDQHHRVWLRMGSQVCTASRRQLERMFQLGHPARKPEIAVSWTAERQGADGSARHDSFGTEIVLSRPGVEELVPTLDDELRRLESEKATGLVFDPIEQEHYLADLQELHEHLHDRARLRDFYSWHLRTHGRDCRLRIVNTGTQTATRIAVHIALPDWLVVVAGRPTRAPPDLVMPFPPTGMTSAERAELKKFVWAFDAESAEMAGLLKAAASHIPNWRAGPAYEPPAEPLGPTHDRVSQVADGMIVVRLDELLHDHAVSDDRPWFILALPDAPLGTHRIPYDLFHKDLLRHEQGELVVVVH